MKYIITAFCWLCLSVIPALAQPVYLMLGPGPSSSSGLTVGTTPITGTSTNGCVLYYNAGVLGCEPDSGTGTVTSVSVVTANGFSCTVANSTTTPAFTCSYTDPTVTDGTSSVANSSTITVGNGLKVSGSGGSAVITPTVADNAQSANYQVAATDMSGTITLTGAHTLTIPAISSSIFAANMSACYADDGTGNWTISTTPTLNGAGLTLYPGDGGCLISNGTSLDWQPGMQAPTSTRHGGVFSSSAPSNNFATGIDTTGALTYAQPSVGNVSGLGTGVATALGNAVNASGGVLTSAATTTGMMAATWDSNTAVVAGVTESVVPWTSYTITSVKSAVTGGGTFAVAIKINGTVVTGCSAITVSGTGNTNTSCTAANTGSAGDQITWTLTSPSGTVNQAYVGVVFTHTVN